MGGTDEPRATSALRDAVEDNKPELIEQLNPTTLFLSYLAKYELIDQDDILKYEREEMGRRKNAEILDGVVQREPRVHDSYQKFLEALKLSDQTHLAELLTNVDRELNMMEQYQTSLETHLNDVNKYLKVEQRRTGTKFSTETPDVRLGNPNVDPVESLSKENMEGFLMKVHNTTKSSMVQFDRCREVIDKLHKDCDDVAKKNADMLSKLRECNRAVNSVAPIPEEPPEVNTNTETAVVPYIAPRSKETEAQAIMENVSKATKRIEDDEDSTKQDIEDARQIISTILKDVRDRRNTLDKLTEAPPKDMQVVKYLDHLTPRDDSRRDFLPRIAPLRTLVESLATDMHNYMQQEKQVAHKLVINKSSWRPHRRNFDQVDKDLNNIKQDLNRNDKDAAMNMVTRVVDNTKAERQECMKLVTEIEQTIKQRKQKLDESSTGKKRIQRRNVIRRSKVVRKVDSNFAKRLENLSSEVKGYVDLELDQGMRHKAEQTKKRQHYENEIKEKRIAMRNMEKKLRDAENEKEKYRKLYNQEKAIKSVALPNKAVFHKRQGDEEESLEGGQQRIADDTPRGKPRLTTRARYWDTKKEKRRPRRKDTVGDIEKVAEENQPQEVGPETNKDKKDEPVKKKRGLFK